MRVRALVLAAVLPLAAIAAPEKWTIDEAHSTARFQVKHLMISNVSGEIGGVKGAFTLDGSDLTKLSADATLDARTVNTNNKQRDEHLKGPDFFNTAKWTTMKFKSKKVTDVSGETFKLVGDLTIRDKTKEVTLDVTSFTAPVKDPWGNMKRGFTATTKLNRKEFGMAWNKQLDNGGMVVSEDINVTIEFELQQAPSGDVAKGGKKS